MSSLKLSKIVSAIVSTALCIVVIDTIGDALVNADGHATPAEVAIIAKDTTTEAMIETAIADAAKKPVPKHFIEVAATESLAALLASANIAKGKKLFKKCAVCHTTDRGGKNMIGPNLWNIVNAERGKKAGFRYSKPLSAMAGNWSYGSLDAFLTKPRSFIRGTKMQFSGIKKATDRAAVIGFLRGLSDTPAPLPQHRPRSKGSQGPANVPNNR